jgi:hypothetical protein
MADWARFAGLSAIFLALLVGSLLWALNYPPQYTDWTCEPQTSTDNQKNGAKQRMICHPIQPAHQYNNLETAEKNREKGTESGFKITSDRLLAVFTGLLAFVTAGLVYVVYVQEANAQVHERAYIFGGGPANVGDPIYMYGTIDNYGKTPGFLKRVDWGIYDEDNFPKDVPVSNIIEYGLLPKGTVRPIEIEDVYPPSIKGQPYLRIKFIHGQNIGRIFFGRFNYHDVFGKNHYSTFKLKLTREGSDPLPGCYSDWS